MLDRPIHLIGRAVQAAVILTAAYLLFWAWRGGTLTFFNPLQFAAVMLPYSLVPFLIASFIRSRSWLLVFVLALTMLPLLIMYLDSFRPIDEREADEWGPGLLLAALMPLAAGALIGGISRAAWLGIRALGYDWRVAAPAQISTAAAILAVIVGPQIWADRQPSASCYRAYAQVSMSGRIFYLPLLAPFHVTRDKGAQYSFEDRPQLNAFCDIRDRTTGPVPIRAFGAHFPILKSNEYSQKPVEPNLAKKLKDFCETTDGQHWRDTLCGGVPGLMPMSLAVSEDTLGEDKCTEGMNCAFNNAWFEISGQALPESGPILKILPQVFTQRTWGNSPNIERSYTHEDGPGYVKHTIQSTEHRPDGQSDRITYLVFFEVDGRHDADGRNLVYRCYMGDQTQVLKYACSTLYRLEPRVFVSYELDIRDTDIVADATAIDERMRLMISELQRKPAPHQP